MKIIVKQEVEVEAKTLHVEAGVRYWQDSKINGVEDDSKDPKIPCAIGGLWKPIIDIDSGQILNWTKGVTADVHYKVCDSGSYWVRDETGKIILSREDDYVPSILCPEENGYGDYIIMYIDENGFIQNWKADMSDFSSDED